MVLGQKGVIVYMIYIYRERERHKRKTRFVQNFVNAYVCGNKKF